MSTSVGEGCEAADVLDRLQHVERAAFEECEPLLPHEVHAGCEVLAAQCAVEVVVDSDWVLFFGCLAGEEGEVRIREELNGRVVRELRRDDHFGGGEGM